MFFFIFVIKNILTRCFLIFLNKLIPTRCFIFQLKKSQPDVLPAEFCRFTGPWLPDTADLRWHLFLHKIHLWTLWKKHTLLI